MMKPCSKVLVLSKNEDVKKSFQILSSSLRVDIFVSDGADVVLEGYDRIIIDVALDRILPEGTDKVLILGSNKLQPYLKSYSRFIFNPLDMRELALALHEDGFSDSSTAVREPVEDIPLKEHGLLSVNFKDDRYYYADKMMYLTAREKKYIFDFFKNGKNEYKDRMILCRMRRRFGKDLLRKI